MVAFHVIRATGTAPAIRPVLHLRWERPTWEVPKPMSSDPPDRSTKTIGLIVNPHSSKDVRRLVALGRVVTVEEKANMVARFLAGVAGGPPTRVLALDDAGGVTRRSVRLAAASSFVSWLPIAARGDETDTFRAAALLRREAADLLVVVGGDGTLRAAVHAWAEARVLLLPAGTNNAFSGWYEPTAAGLAAAHADPIRHREAYRPRPVLMVEGPGSRETAVVDVVAVRERWVASRALWRRDHLIEAVVTTADPMSVGIAGIAAAFGPLEAGHIRHLRFGPGTTVRAVFGPGLIGEVSVADVEDRPVGGEYRLTDEVGVVALDGERRMVEASRSRVTSRWGPSAFQPGAVLSALGAV